MNLTNKVILLTGASSGIGESVAKELARYKVNLVITARREDRLKNLATDLYPKVKSITVIPCDLTKRAQIDELIEKVIERHGKIDILLNIAGWGSYGWIEDLSWEDIRGQYDVNIVAMAYLIHKVVPSMKERKSGVIVNMSSYASKVAIPPMNIYASTKYAVEGLTDALRRELSAWGIKVIRIHPGSVSGTEFNQKAHARGGQEYKLAGIGRVSREYAAKKIIEAIKKEKKVVMFSWLYRFPAFINLHFPFLVDWAMKIWVKWERKGELKKENQS